MGEIAEAAKLKAAAAKSKGAKHAGIDKVQKWKEGGISPVAAKKKEIQIARSKMVEEANKLSRLRAKPNAEVRTLYSWGDGSKGQLGHGELYTLAFFQTQSGQNQSTSQAKEKKFTCTGAPRKVTALLPKEGEASHKLGTIVTIFAHGTISSALTNKGTVLTWGDNTFGQLGLGDRLNRNVPCLVTQGWVKVNSGGADH